MTETRTVHVCIEGRVQGVGYRYWTERMARELGVTGWVRNRRDGSVEAVFQGAAAAIDDMIAQCWVGPAESVVARVDIVGEGVGDYRSFEVRGTG